MAFKVKITQVKTRWQGAERIQFSWVLAPALCLVGSWQGAKRELESSWVLAPAQCLVGSWQGTKGEFGVLVGSGSCSMSCGFMTLSSSFPV